MKIRRESSRKNIWVVIPGWNEEKYLDKLLKKVQKYTRKIIFVNDGSSDQSSKVASKYSRHVLNHEVNLGKGAALKTGCQYAFQKLKADAVVLMDADGQHDPKELPLFFAALKRAHLVLGTRDTSKNMPVLRATWNRSISFLIYLFFRIYIKDIPCGYKAFTKKVYPLIEWESTNYAIEVEVAVRIGKHKIAYSVLPIATIYQDTNRGMTMLDVLGIMFQIINWRFVL